MLKVSFDILNDQYVSRCRGSVNRISDITVSIAIATASSVVLEILNTNTVD